MTLRATATSHYRAISCFKVLNASRSRRTFSRSWSASKRREQENWSRPTDDSLAVIIPVRNEEAALGACLDAVMSGSVLPDEVLIIDGESADGTREIACAYAQRDSRIRVLRNPHQTIPHALNIGWRATKCSLIVRVDGHACICNDYLETARYHLLSGDWQGVGGPKHPVSTTPIGRTIAAAMSSRWGVGNSRYHYAQVAETAEHVPFGAYPRHVIESLGGWDEELLVNQDYEFDYRLRQKNGSILFDPRMISKWACASSLQDLAHQYYRYGRGKVRVARKHPKSLRARHLLPPALSATLAITTILASALRSGPLGFLVGMYVLATASSGLSKAARSLPPSQQVAFPLVVATMHNAWGIGFLDGLARSIWRGAASDPYRHRRLAFEEQIAE